MTNSADRSKITLSPLDFLKQDNNFCFMGLSRKENSRPKLQSIIIDNKKQTKKERKAKKKEEVRRAEREPKKSPIRNLEGDKTSANSLRTMDGMKQAL